MLKYILGCYLNTFVVLPVQKWNYILFLWPFQGGENKYDTTKLDAANAAQTSMLVRLGGFSVCSDGNPS